MPDILPVPPPADPLPHPPPMPGGPDVVPPDDPEYDRVNRRPDIDPPPTAPPVQDPTKDDQGKRLDR